MGDLFGNEQRSAPAAGGRFALVALEQGLDAHRDGLTYIVPEALGDLSVGDRVLVPLGRRDRPVSGYITAITTETSVDPAKLKPIAARDPGALALPESLMDLARWISAYYCCPLGMVLVTMLPAAVTLDIAAVTTFSRPWSWSSATKVAGSSLGWRIFWPAASLKALSVAAASASASRFRSDRSIPERDTPIRAMTVSVLTAYGLSSQGARKRPARRITPSCEGDLSSVAIR